MAHLVIKKGRRAGEKIELSQVITLGRGADVDLRLDDLTVSKRHSRIVRNASGDYVLEDLASSNGTFLNGKSITTKRLRNGDEIGIGNTIFEFGGALPKPPPQKAKVLIGSGSEDRTTPLVKTAVDASYEPQQDTASGQTTVEGLSKANYRLAILLEISHSLGMALDEDELLDKILDELFDVFPETNRGFIILRDPDTGQLTPGKSRIRKSRRPDDEQLQISETILEYVLDRKQGVLIEDTMQDERLPTSQSILDFDMRSVMCVPLKWEDQVLGFIQLDTNRIAANYDENGLTLLVAIANQCALTIANARLHKQLVRQERLEQDLQNARRIQSSFLPQAPPAVAGYQFEDAYATALAVGGDFFDFVELPDGRMAIVVGDVSGKGITAALMMAKMASNVRFFATTQSGPGQLLARLNEVALDSESDMFVTVLIMFLDPINHVLTMSNAGHCYPLIRKRGGEVSRLEKPTGFPLGIIEDAEFEEETASLEPGDIICVFTDGIIEAMDDQNEQFGYEKLSESLSSASAGPKDAVKSIQKALREFTGMAPQSDDLTLVCFGRFDGQA
ncbi:MAG: SpoIIE family protein phosphatase [Planctomycetes bacterium]|nr:SpoIIE family protein phosphatase [Planctomycetota bacterium]